MASKMALQIDTPIQYLKGVGPKLSILFERRGISTVGQLLEWIPRGYEDRRRARSISTLVAEERVSFVADLQGTRTIPLGSGHRKIYEVNVADGTGRISLKFFRLPYKGYIERLRDLNKVRVSGKVINYRGKLEIHHPEIHPIEDDINESDNENDILLPLYTETEGLSPQKIRKIVGLALETMGQFIVDPLPNWIIEKYKLVHRAEAIRSLHIPDPALAEELNQFKSPAHLRLIFEEFFWLELKLALKRSQIRSETAPAMPNSSALLDKLKTTLPFQLTNAQVNAYAEIEKDLCSDRPMHRLVQGDVGCGKTLVAFMAALKVKDNGFKSALMAPTEILAEQHFLNAQKFLEPLGVKVLLLTGSMKGKEKEVALQELEAGNYDLVIGTHALIQEKVVLKDLALAIIDEQHRFGVDQRAKLKAKTRLSNHHKAVSSVHFLVMTATPIPRTLAMTAYGDLDFTIINELPPGRTPVVTKKVFPNKRENVYSFLQEQVQKGRQAYIVYPLIEESEKLDLKNAVDGIKDLSAQYPTVRFKLLHGKMNAEEKENIMKSFKNAEFDVLVSTTVIEVGVDVPNASLMIIEEATRFGLSQLHQLRGRVGRGAHKSYCVLMLGHALSEVARKRAEIMEQTTDGFVIAEADLELRGPGEFMGTRQSGLPGFKYAHIVRDQDLLKQAIEAAFECLKRDPGLLSAENKAIKSTLQTLIDQSVG